MKIFLFHDNENKPIFHGTYSKKSAAIKARRPCSSKDETLVDYDFDSDAEWVDEEPGESLSSDDVVRVLASLRVWISCSLLFVHCS